MAFIILCERVCGICILPSVLERPAEWRQLLPVEKLEQKGKKHVVWLVKELHGVSFLKCL